jgi:hypothetical protein
MQRDLPTTWDAPMLEQINPLPGPQGELALHDRNRKLHASQRRADVGRHVVWAFVCMPISPRLLRRQAVEKCLEIGANIRRGVLLNEQSGRGVATKQGQEPGLQPARPEPIQDIARNLDEPSATGRNQKNIDELAHLNARCCRGTRSTGNSSVILALLGRPRERLTQAEAKMRLIILIILIILIVGAVPAWPYSTDWGYYPAGGLGTILIILLILALLGYV